MVVVVLGNDVWFLIGRGKRERIIGLMNLMNLGYAGDRFQMKLNDSIL